MASGNVLSPARYQAITWTNDDLLWIGPLATNFSEKRIETQNLFIHENAFENVVCEVVAILYKKKWVNWD